VLGFVVMLLLLGWHAHPIREGAEGGAVPGAPHAGEPK